MSGQVLICLSQTRDEAARFEASGPRRDIQSLAAAVGGEVVYRAGSGGRKGLRAKLFGPHVGHAWEAARRAGGDATVFADGEHVGLPLAVFLALRGKRRVRLIVLGHYVNKPWKRALLRLGGLLQPRGTLVVHSATQRDQVRGATRWGVELLPYQVDTAYWQTSTVPAGRPVVVAVGSENRDYDVLAEAARGLDVEVRIAAGSHWARLQAEASNLPENVTYIAETLGFDELRALYEEASVVVVPLREASNQSGITTMLEAMSMGRPLVVTANRGQRETVAGPLISAHGRDSTATADRGPQLFGFPRPAEPTGMYVAPGDSEGLRAAIELVLADPEQAARMARAGAQSVREHFTLEQFVERFAAIILAANDEAVGNATLVSAR